MCRECAYFANLDINIEQDSGAQTRSQPYLLMTGIFLSPAFWVLLALPLDYPVMMLISAIAIMVATFVGICLVIYGYGLERSDKKKAKKLSRRPSMAGVSESVERMTTLSWENTVRLTTGEIAGTRIEDWFKGTPLDCM